MFTTMGANALHHKKSNRSRFYAIERTAFPVIQKRTFNRGNLF